MSYIRRFSEISMKDLSLVGGKNASLGEMYQALRGKGVRIPEGFVVTADAFSALLENSDLSTQVYEKLDQLNTSDLGSLEKVGRQIRELIRASGLPLEVKTDIRNAYAELCQLVGVEDLDVAVRSSATAEDLPGASFAGQQETFLNVTGADALIEACVHCFASLFTNRAISYRETKGFDHRTVRLSIGIQRMVRSDEASSGVIFTLDTETGSRNVILVTSAYGLGENIVGGRVDPDEFVVLKSVLESAKIPIIRRKLGSKQLRMVYADHGTRRTKNIDVSLEDQKKFSLNDEDVIELAKWSQLIENYYSQLNKNETPMDIEWAKDGINGELFILQARPETVHAIKASEGLGVMSLKERSQILLKGRAVGSKIGAGPVKIIKNVSELKDFEEGDVLVADMTDPDWEPLMKKASAIITNRGGRTCHAAIVSREHGVPCVVGTGNATSILRNGQEVTVSCAEGEEGIVLKGKLRFITLEKSLDDLPRPRTKIMVNVGNPDQALKASLLPVDGVGLARLEFIIAEHVKVHPMALLHPEKINNEFELKEIQELIQGYEKDPGEYFVQKLAEGVAMIAGAFHPRPVVVRLSDFKTNEYAHLLGGKAFEPREENPMLGFRGASRYYHDAYREGFALECRALKIVRESMGLTNVKVMVPFCRTADEGEKVIKEMRSNGLEQGVNGLEVYVMCELPSNVMDLHSFAKIFDGFSIGSNDLTQMTLGVDRDSELISSLFDERNPAVLRMLSLAVDGAKQAGRQVGICGQAPSDYPEIASFLVEHGIDSISLSPDSVLKNLAIVRDAESRFLNESI